MAAGGAGGGMRRDGDQTGGGLDTSGVGKEGEEGGGVGKKGRLCADFAEGGQAEGGAAG